MKTRTIKVGISNDVISAAFDEATAFLEREATTRGFGVEYERVPPQPGNVATATALDGYDAFLVSSVVVDASSVRGLERLAVVARWGVGFDRIDVPALTAADVALANTPNSVRVPVAEAVITLIYALAKNLFFLDRATRGGRWRFDLPKPARDIDGKVLGSLGCGNIGRELFRRVRSLGFTRLLACDPMLDSKSAGELGIELVALEELCRESDFLCVLTPLNEQTRGLIGAPQLASMKPTSFVINTARGGIVDERALVDALRSGTIAGAGIDVFEREPPPKDHPYFSLENVIVSPHALAWTENSVSGNTTEACANIVSLLVDGEPRFVVNRDVLERPKFRAKLARLRG
ncbi:MAG: dehydrogenase [Candidatus Eremiobacteraeota bacterium]|nr:dehydrogenase [Candidatus Eremiobacteraeota bacterium]